MSIEKAKTRPVRKPWGRTDLSPWQANPGHTEPVGEVWFERAEPSLPESRLLLKLLFTSAPLSIQVHPDDAHAHAKGLPNGKTEGWYVLSTETQARIGLGLRTRVSEQALRTAIADRSVVDLLDWRAARAGEAVLVPAGAIHAIGAGIVLAEVQQRSDATYRLFDHGSERQLHVEEALAVADRGPVVATAAPMSLTSARTVLLTSAYFVIEKVCPAPGSRLRLQPGSEAWLLVLRGSGQTRSLKLQLGEGFYMADGHADIQVDDAGIDLLVAYAAHTPRADLLASFEPPAPAEPATANHPTGADA